MRILGIAVAVVISFSVNAVAGEENLMAMRGRSLDGEVKVNRVQAGRVGGGYVGWRDVCVRREVLVGGGVLELGEGNGFDMAPRFTVCRERGGEGSFLGALARELVSGGVGCLP